MLHRTIAPLGTSRRDASSHSAIYNVFGICTVKMCFSFLLVVLFFMLNPPIEIGLYALLDRQVFPVNLACLTVFPNRPQSTPLNCPPLIGY